MAAESNSVADQRRLQASWRPWDEMLDRIQVHHRAAKRSSLVSDQNAPQEVKQAISCVDVGCGTGEVLRLMSDRGWNVVMGIDRDADMLRAAADCTTVGPSKQLPLVRGDARDLPRILADDCEDGEKEPPTRVDLIWTSFTVQYFMDELPEIISCWKECLSDSGLLAIVETNGLFSVHEPLADANLWRRMEDELLTSRELNYDCFAGPKLSRILQSCGVEVVEDSEWDDAELAFQGPAPPAILRAWQGRLERMHYPRNFFGDQFEQRVQEFLECLQSEKHRTNTKIRLVIAQKGQSRLQATSAE